jgi:hypothetical protein
MLTVGDDDDRRTCMFALVGWKLKTMFVHFFLSVLNKKKNSIEQ